MSSQFRLSKLCFWFLVFVILAVAIVPIFMPVPQRGASIRTFSIRRFNGTWAGYEVIPTAGFYATFVNASWTVPEVTCMQGSDISMLIWVGLGGLSFNTTHEIANIGLEQIGTRIDCIDGTPKYSTGYELRPKQLSTVPLPNIIQKPGDNVTASVSYSNSTGEFTFELTSSSSPIPQSFSISWTNGTLSAEWIVEAPGGNCTQPRYSMPDFRSVTFWDCFVTVGNNTGVITDFGSRPYSSLNELSYICLYSTNLKAIPHTIVDNGRRFTVSWLAGGTC